MRLIGLGFLVLIAGCGVVQKVRDIGVAPVPEPIILPSRTAVPQFAAFEIDTVIVAMDDGLQCRGPSGAALGAAGWSGTFVECPYPYSYAVELAAGTVAGREFLEEVPVDVIVKDGEVPFRPLVTVLITDTDGRRYRFQSLTGF